MDWLTAELMGRLSPWGLIVGGLYGLLTGHLVPRSVVNDVRADRDARLAEAHAQIVDLREVHRLSERARELQAEALRESLEVARAAEEALKGFRAATAWADRERGGTG